MTLHKQSKYRLNAAGSESKPAVSMSARGYSQHGRFALGHACKASVDRWHTELTGIFTWYTSGPLPPLST
jgi:hypothetical protein